METNFELKQRLWELVRELRELSLDVPIIVEGKRDREALRRLGVEGQILTLHHGKGMYEVARELDRFDEVVLLLDWDARGDQQLETLKRHLDCNWQNHSWIRKRFRDLVGESLVEVEHLFALLGEEPPDLEEPIAEA